MTLHEKYIKAVKNFKPVFGNDNHLQAIKYIEEINNTGHNITDSLRPDSPRSAGLKEIVIKLTK